MWEGWVGGLAVAVAVAVAVAAVVMAVEQCGTYVLKEGFSFLGMALLASITRMAFFAILPVVRL